MRDIHERHPGDVGNGKRHGRDISVQFAGKKHNKYDAVMDYAARHGYRRDEILFIGDDFDDGGGDSHVRIFGMDYIHIHDFRNFPRRTAFLLDLPVASSLVSPDGRVSCAFSLEDGRPVADVSYDGKRVFRTALGIDRGKVRMAESEARTVRGSWKPVWGFKSEYPENYMELELKLVREMRTRICKQCGREEETTWAGPDFFCSDCRGKYRNF